MCCVDESVDVVRDCVRVEREEEIGDDRVHVCERESVSVRESYLQITPHHYLINGPHVFFSIQQLFHLKLNPPIPSSSICINQLFDRTLFLVSYFVLCVFLEDIMRATALQKEILSNSGGNTGNNTVSTATAAASSGEKSGETLVFTDSSIISRQSLSVGRGDDKNTIIAADDNTLKKEAQKKIKENAPDLPVQVTYATRPKKAKKSV